MKKVVLFLIVFILNSNIYSIELRNYPITISYLNEAMGISNVGSHPGYKIGTYHTYLNQGHHKLMQSLDVGYYFHAYFQHGLYLCSAFNYRYTTNFGLFTSSGLGIGYMHTWMDGDVYEKGKDGYFTTKTDYGHAHLLPSLSFDIGYDFNKIDFMPLALSLEYEILVETPFSEQSSIMPHNLITFSLEFSWR